MLVDCDSCPVRGRRCDGCVISTLFDDAPLVTVRGHRRGSAVAEPVQSMPDGDDAEHRALEVLAGAGFDVTVLARDATGGPIRAADGNRDSPDQSSRLRLVSSPGRRGHAA